MSNKISNLKEHNMNLKVNKIEVDLRMIQRKMDKFERKTDSILAMLKLLYGISKRNNHKDSGKRVWKFQEWINMLEEHIESTCLTPESNKDLVKELIEKAE